MAERRFSRSVRARITLVATAVVATTVAIGGTVFLLILSATLFESAATAAENEASRFAMLIESSGAEALTETDGYAQLLSNGRVIAATDDLEDAPALLFSETDEPVTVTNADDDETLVVAAAEIEGYLLVAGVADESREEALDTTRALLLVTIPVIVVLVSATCWIVVGRALRPVERMRLAAEQVTAAELDRRIEVPGSGDEIDRLATTMNRMLDRLQTSQTQQRRFVSDASHELRSPVSSLRQNAEIARSYPDRITPTAFATVVAEESERMTELIDGLLLLARADEARIRPARRPVDLDDLALREVHRVRGGTTEVDGSSISAARVSGDDTMLSRALRNLVDNAVRHRRHRIAVSSCLVDGFALLAVDDDGAGVPAAERSRVFDRFVRLDEARSRDAGGSGLGLAIVAEITAAHGGSARVVESALGGARFEIWLPTTEE